MKEATGGAEKEIGDCIKSHPENLIATIAEAKEKLKSGHYAFTIVS